MKKLLLILLLFTFIVTLSACNAGDIIDDLIPDQNDTPNDQDDSIDQDDPNDQNDDPVDNDDPIDNDDPVDDDGPVDDDPDHLLW